MNDSLEILGLYQREWNFRTLLHVPLNGKELIVTAKSMQKMGMYVVLEIYVSVEALNADLLGLGVFLVRILRIYHYCNF